MSDPQSTFLIDLPHDVSATGAEIRPAITPLKIEAHMLSIASILFDVLSELPKNDENILDIIDNKN